MAFSWGTTVSTVFAQDDIYDVKSPVGIPVPWFWFGVFTFLLVVGAVAWGMLSRDGQPKEPAPAAPLLPWELALQRLKELEEKKYLASVKFHEYFFELSDILRHYIEDRYQIDAPERTTEEFLSSVRNLEVLTGAQKNMLKNFLVECDKVKFAKHAPSMDDAHWAFGIARSFIEQTTIVQSEMRMGSDGV